MATEVSGDMAASGEPSAAVLLIVGEPFSETSKQQILDEIIKGLGRWDSQATGVDLHTALTQMALTADLGEERRNGERVIQQKGGAAVVEVLINAQVDTLKDSLKKLLTLPCSAKALIYAGYVFQGTPAWVMQDDLFSSAMFSQVFRDPNVENALKKTAGTSLLLSTPRGSDWSTALKGSEAHKLLKLSINPGSKGEDSGVTQFCAYLSSLVRVSELTSMLASSDVIGNISFSRPVLYIFPGQQGDAALFGMKGFNMLVDGGYSRRPCFWDFVRHLDGIDALLLTHLGPDNLFGIKALLERKVRASVHPDIDYMYMTASKAVKDSAQGQSELSELVINLAAEGSMLVDFSRKLGHAPHPLTRSLSGNLEPVNLYHKVGKGSLDMYVLNPVGDAKETREFLTQWGNQASSFTHSNGIPVPNCSSICALLVVRPANSMEKVTRILFPGTAPQHKLLEGLERVKHLEFMKHPSFCSHDLHKARKAAMSSARASSTHRRPASMTVSQTTKAEPPKQLNTRPQSSRTTLPSPASAKTSKMQRDSSNKRISSAAKDKGKVKKDGKEKEDMTKSRSASSPTKASTKTVSPMKSPSSGKSPTSTSPDERKSSVKKNACVESKPAAADDKPSSLDVTSVNPAYMTPAAPAKADGTPSSGLAASPEALPEPDHSDPNGHIGCQQPPDAQQGKLRELGIYANDDDDDEGVDCYDEKENGVKDFTEEDVQPQALPEPVAVLETPTSPDGAPYAFCKPSLMEQSLMEQSQLFENEIEPDYGAEGQVTITGSCIENEQRGESSVSALQDTGSLLLKEPAASVVGPSQSVDSSADTTIGFQSLESSEKGSVLEKADEPVLSEPDVEPVMSESEVEPMKSEPEVEPVMSEPEVEPVMSKPDMEPEMTEPDAEPVMSEPDVEPVMSESKVEPVMSKPDMEPERTEPYAEPVMSEPDMKPVMSEPDVEPVMSEPDVRKTEEPAMSESDVQETEEPLMSELDVQKTEEPVMSELDVQKTEEPVMSEPDVQKTEEPVMSEPDVQKTEEPVMSEKAEDCYAVASREEIAVCEGETQGEPVHTDDSMNSDTAVCMEYQAYGIPQHASFPEEDAQKQEPTENMSLASQDSLGPDISEHQEPKYSVRAHDSLEDVGFDAAASSDFQQTDTESAPSVDDIGEHGGFHRSDEEHVASDAAGFDGFREPNSTPGEQYFLVSKPASEGLDQPEDSDGLHGPVSDSQGDGSFFLKEHSSALEEPGVDNNARETQSAHDESSFDDSLKEASPAVHDPHVDPFMMETSPPLQQEQDVSDTLPADPELSDDDNLGEPGSSQEHCGFGKKDGEEIPVLNETSCDMKGEETSPVMTTEGFDDDAEREADPRLEALAVKEKEASPELQGSDTKDVTAPEEANTEMTKKENTPSEETGSDARETQAELGDERKTSWMLEETGVTEKAASPAMEEALYEQKDHEKSATPTDQSIGDVTDTSVDTKGYELNRALEQSQYGGAIETELIQQDPSLATQDKENSLDSDDDTDDKNQPSTPADPYHADHAQSSEDVYFHGESEQMRGGFSNAEQTDTFGYSRDSAGTGSGCSGPEAGGEIWAAKVGVLTENVSDRGHEDLAESEEDLADRKEEMADTKEDMVDGKEDMADRKEDVVDSKEEMADRKEDLADTKEEMADRKEELADMKEDLADTKEEMADRKEEMADTKEEMADRKEEMADRKEEMADTKEDLADRKEDMADMKEDMADRKEEMADTKEDLADTKEEMADRKEEMVDRKEDLADRKEEMADTKEEMADRKEDLADRKEEMADTKEDLADRKEDMADRKEEMADTKEELADTKGDKADTKEDMVDSKEDMAFGEYARQVANNEEDSDQDEETAEAMDSDDSDNEVITYQQEGRLRDEGALMVTSFTAASEHQSEDTTQRDTAGNDQQSSVIPAGGESDMTSHHSLLDQYEQGSLGQCEQAEERQLDECYGLEGGLGEDADMQEMLAVQQAHQQAHLAQEEDSDLDSQDLEPPRNENEPFAALGDQESSAASPQSVRLTQASEGASSTQLATDTSSEADGSEFDPLNQWGHPMGLPAPTPPETSNKSSQDRKAAGDAKKSEAAKKSATSPTKGKTGLDKRSPTKLSPRGMNGETAKSANTKSELKRGTPETPRSARLARSADTSRQNSRTRSAPTTPRRPASSRSRVSPEAVKMQPLPPFTPFYVDLTYIPNHGDLSYVDIEFFKRVRARNYVLSARNPNPKVLEMLMEAKESWDKTNEHEVTVIPTYETPLLQHWMAVHQEKLAQCKIDMAPAASRCTVRLQDHEDSCYTYRLEF